jgi:hypothetical protein
MIIGGITHYWRIGLMPGDVRVAEGLGFVGLTDILLAPLFFYLLAGLLFPRSGEDGPVDLKDFYYENRAWFFGTLVVSILPATAWELIRLHFGLEALPLYLLPLVFGALAVSRNQRFHMAMAILMLLAAFAIPLTL